MIDQTTPQKTNYTYRGGENTNIKSWIDHVSIPKEIENQILLTSEIMLSKEELVDMWLTIFII